MIGDNNIRRSMVLPKWLEYPKAINTKDLSIPKAEPFKINSYTENQISKQLDDFISDPSMYKPADPMGAAIVINDHDTATEMARYVLKASKLATPTLELAEKILNLAGDNGLTYPHLPTDKRIAFFKKEVLKYPHNSINWMELARCYTIKGQKYKARRAVTIALCLSPINRYIVRSGVRFFVHIGEYDAAYHYIKKALGECTDSWIKALEVSISQKLKVKLGRTKRLLPSNPSFDEIFHYSELFESVGMLELDSGNIKNAKKNFKVAWQNPSESVVRHGEWVLRNKLPTLRPSSVLHFENSREAMACHDYYELRLEEALEKVIEWELEEPYSANPYLLGSHISDNLEQYEKAVEFTLRGLSANPKHFMLTNNLCYSLIKQNKLDEAKECLDNCSTNLQENELLFYNATSGLYEFKRGNIEAGRELYYLSFKKCKELGSERLLSRALLNLAVAEAEARTNEYISISEAVLKRSKHQADDPSIFLLRKKLQSLIGP